MARDQRILATTRPTGYERRKTPPTLQPVPAVLTESQIEAYHRDGYLLIEGFVDPERCCELRAAAQSIVADFQPSAARTVFTTHEQERASNSEFLDSGAGVWCFFEEDAFGPDGELSRPKELSINKIGHAMHDCDPVFESFSYRPELAGVVADVGMTDALALQSMYIFKQPHIGGEVGCHQDASFLWTDPVTVTGLWFAIEDATLDNGCLWVAPGGHRGPLRQLFRRQGEGGTEFVELDATSLPGRGDLVPVEARAGSMVLLHGLLPHWSDVNHSPVSRHAYSLHCISGDAEYPASNWLQRPADMPLRRLDRALVR